MSKHTPGPWNVTGPQIDAPASDGGVWSIALVNVRNDAHRANARLIAAAPAMYAVLRAAYHALKSYEHGNSAPALAAGVAEEIAAVIAEVCGEEPTP